MQLRCTPVVVFLSLILTTATGPMVLTAADDDPKAAEQPKLRATLRGHTGKVTGVAISPDGKTLASASSDKTVRLWKAATGEEIARFTGHTQGVWSVAFSPDGRTLASAGGNLEKLTDGEIMLWDLATRKEKSTLQREGGVVLSVAFSPDGKTLASGGPAGRVRVWDVATGRERATLAANTDQVVSAVAFHPDGRILASAHIGTGDWKVPGKVVLWDVAEKKKLHDLKGHQYMAPTVCFGRDGKLLASGGWDQTVRLWEVTSGKERAVFRRETPGSAILSVAFSPDGKLLASGNLDKTAVLFDVASGKANSVLKGHTQAVSTVVFSPDGKLLATGSWDKTIQLWDMASTSKSEP